MLQGMIVEAVELRFLDSTAPIWNEIEAHPSELHIAALIPFPPLSSVPVSVEC